MEVLGKPLLEEARFELGFEEVGGTGKFGRDSLPPVDKNA